MSMEAIERFYERLMGDESLQEQAKEIINQGGFIDFAKGQGYDFTAEELEAFTVERAAKAVPLNDEELDKVAAGGLYNEDGYLGTTVAYGCRFWHATTREWVAVKGQCGSCSYWYPSPLFYLGSPGLCFNDNNRRDL